MCTVLLLLSLHHLHSLQIIPLLLSLYQLYLVLPLLSAHHLFCNCSALVTTPADRCPSSVHYMNTNCTVVTPLCNNISCAVVPPHPHSCHCSTWAALHHLYSTVVSPSLSLRRCAVIPSLCHSVTALMCSSTVVVSLHRCAEVSSLSPH